MGSPVTLSTMTALAIAGAGFGVYLGKSAIAEINPSYFAAPSSASVFHSDLIADPSDVASAPVVSARADDFSGLGTGCGGCRTYPEEYIPVRDAAVDSFDAPTSYAPGPDRLIEDVDAEIAAAIARREAAASVERYAHSPIASDEVKTWLASAPAESAPAAEGCAVEGQCEGTEAPGV